MRKILTFLLILLLQVPAFAGGHHVRAIRNAVSGGYNFWLAVPKDYKKDGKPLPLVVFLHGASLCGRDMNRAKRYGTINAIEKGLELDAIVIGPQNPGGAWKPSRIVKVMEYVESHYNVDRNREYALGMSLGSFGTLDLVGTYPDRFAAAIAICGGTQLKNYEGLASLPLWIIHGTADRAVPVSRSREIVSGIRAKFDDDLLRYSELKGVNHSKPCRLFYHIDTYDWLLKHHLKHRMVDRGYEIDPSTVRKPYDLVRRHPLEMPFEGECDASLTPYHGDDKEVLAENETAKPTETAKTSAETAKKEEPRGSKKAATPTKRESRQEKRSDRSDKKTAASAKKFHKVRPGDTLYSIARKNQTSVKKLCQLNGLKENGTLSIGQKIRVK